MAFLAIRAAMRVNLTHLVLLMDATVSLLDLVILYLSSILCRVNIILSHIDVIVNCVLGLAVARDIKGKWERIVSVISNETTTAGQVYEAMSNAGYLDSNLVVILNDSRHSLHPKPDNESRTPINALSSAWSKLQSSKAFRKLREVAKVYIYWQNETTIFLKREMTSISCVEL